MGALSPTHWLIIVGVLVVLFGAKRLPDAARSIGRSARILKSEVKELHPDDADADAAPTAQAPAATPVPAPAALPAPAPVAVEEPAAAAQPTPVTVGEQAR